MCSQLTKPQKRNEPSGSALTRRESVCIRHRTARLPSLIASPLSHIFCSILARQPLYVVQFQHKLVHPEYVRTNPEFSVVRPPLANSSFCWIVGPCGVLFAVAIHGLPTHKFKNCKSQTLSPSRRLTQRVFSAPVGVNNKNSSMRSRLPTETRRIHLMFNLAHPLNGFAPSTLLQMAQHLQCSPCHEDYDMAFSHVLLLENCSQPMHCAEPSSPSAHAQVQFLSCISLRRLPEMLVTVPESSNLLILHAPSSRSSVLALQAQSNMWIDTV